MNRNVVVTISNNEYEEALLSKKCLSHLMNRTRSKDHNIETYEINNISLSYFDQNNGYDRLTLGY